MGSLYWIRDDFVYAPSQWETTLQCNVVSHWLGACTEWSCWMKAGGINQRLSLFQLWNKLQHLHPVSFGDIPWFWSGLSTHWGRHYADDSFKCIFMNETILLLRNGFLKIQMITELFIILVTLNICITHSKLRQISPKVLAFVQILANRIFFVCLFLIQAVTNLHICPLWSSWQMCDFP